MSRVISIGTAVPSYQTNQVEILEFMKQAYADPLIARKLSVLFAHSGISTRNSVLPDFNVKDEAGFFQSADGVPDVLERQDQFKLKVIPLAMAAIEDSFQAVHPVLDKKDVTHLITVTCTGLYSPGIDTAIIHELSLRPDIMHTSVNFQGCNAAFPAMQMADIIARSDEDALVMVVCVELCTLHFQSKPADDYLVSNTIFGDGAAVVLVTSDEQARKCKLAGFEIKGFYSWLLHQGKDLLGWNISPRAFEMILDAALPELIGEHVETVLEKAFMHYKISRDQIQFWAVHPGGKRILDSFRKKIKLEREDLKYSYSVLDNHGNMSSPTILFVLQAIWKTHPKVGEKIVALGFGPGLSIDTAQFHYVQ